MTAVASKISEIAQLLGYLGVDDMVEASQYLVEASPIWVPLPGPQTAAYYSDADILYYGGAAGGGKKDEHLTVR